MRSYIVLLLLSCLLFSCERGKDKILVFSKTKGYRHESIEAGKVALIELGKKNNFEVDTTESASNFNEENLKRYKAIVFLNTTQDVLDPVQQVDFKRFIEAGGGFVGIHAAADTEYEWPWYGKLVGAYFKSHPQVQEATIKKVRPFGPNTLPDTWTKTDEWYNYKNISSDLNVIYNLDETTYKGGENGESHPIAWYHEYEGGRAFYTGLGHTDETFSDPLFQEHLLQGIQYAIGKDKLDYGKVKSRRMPEENRFTKTVLDINLNEPTEMAILPDGKILFAERKGDIKLYTPSDGKVKVVNTLSVGVKFEDGVIGLTADPNFKENNWVYIFYSHPQKSANVLSRFVFKDDKIDVSSEKQMLEVPTQRETCCHTGGSLTFGPGANLFISTGDNTSPFESDGYSPSDERTGRSPFDAQKSSSNTNDLRGKILRIHPEPDGTYTIPEGNLFAKGEPNTCPEIYVMGCRNPYRISVDFKTGYLYWGEVGPDAGENDSLRGPRGYDEVNLAKKAGFFGWPYFVGNNYSYAKYDFATKKVSKRWDASAPLNESPNNTGKKELPPATPAFIWYPYAKSEEFPMVKDGGRNAMAGPIYYSENFKGMETAFPDYFDGKLLIYDWMRNWMFLVTTDEQSNIKDIEPFMANTKFNNIMDLAYGPDGRLYMLEYGTQWFKQNIDARLIRIDYNGGNRPPVAMLTADKFNGAVPLSVNFTAKGSHDPDGDGLKYELTINDQHYQSDDGNFKVNLDKEAVYTPVLKVTDSKGTFTTAKLQVIAGNEAPVVKTQITEGNKTFYFPETPIRYAVTVNDKEDGSTENGSIKADAVTISFDYLKGYDMTAIAQGHQMPTVELPGKTLIDKSDCKSCHLIDQKSAGPSYKDVAKKYKGQTGAVDQLAAKIIKGGSGVWGTTEMAAHPQVSVEDAKQMVEYILSLTEEKEAKKLPLAGTVKPGKQEEGAYILTATYFDRGASPLPPISSFSTIALRSPMLKADQATELNTVRLIRNEGQVGLDNVKNNSSAAYKDIDLTGVRSANVVSFMIPNETVGGEVELRLDKLDGELLGKVVVNKTGISTGTIRFKEQTGVHSIYVIFINPDAGAKKLFYHGGIKLSNK
ncbi:ThuA domain-containing protein [Chryseosolibacter indicus]|uniref:ThuA domain-containing protein n=1 Tax=Chryseosolibacter indicus TaxID=2782351 RepID=A0ABS5VM12_9BACT|nr:ThuA domain-containing protein [Chryseosolibacter indicus]MBT1701812.1 ThuA domain-containing protein [Chryseosolibacter indicus]